MGLLCRKLTFSFLSSCHLQIDSSVLIKAPAIFTLSMTAVTLSGWNLCRPGVCLYSLSEFICVSCVWKPCFHSLVSSTPFDTNYLVATSFAGIYESREKTGLIKTASIRLNVPMSINICLLPICSSLYQESFLTIPEWDIYP